MYGTGISLHISCSLLTALVACQLRATVTEQLQRAKDLCPLHHINPWFILLPTKYSTTIVADLTKVQHCLWAEVEARWTLGPIALKIGGGTSFLGPSNFH